MKVNFLGTWSVGLKKRILSLEAENWPEALNCKRFQFSDNLYSF